MKKNDTYVNDNIGLVRTCAARFKGRGIEYDDLFQAGCVGLIKAVAGFNESLGFKFSTYAVPVILGEIKRLFRESGTVKVSRSIKDLSLKIKRLQDKMIKNLGRDPSVSEIAEFLNIDKDQVIEALSASVPPMSLTSCENDENQKEIDIKQESIEETLTDILSLRQSINNLNAEDRVLIYLRFFKNNSQSKTARILGTTQVQISRRERKILFKLKNDLT